MAARDQHLATSPYNRDPRVLQGLKIPSRVAINDVTLREGEQTAQVSFSLEDKINLAHRMDDIGVSQIEVGWPNKSSLDREALRILKGEGLRAKTHALATLYGQEWRREVDASISSGADVVGLLHATSDIRLEYSEKISRAQVVDKVAEAIRYAVGRGPVIGFTPVDTTRTDLDFLKQIVEEAVAAGAERITLADTVGAAGPGAIRFLVSQVTGWVNVPVQVHCHNDFGLALANALAAVEGGATMIDAAINGLGERSGNPALDEVVVALKLHLGVETGVELAKLYDLSRAVQEITGVPLPFNKALVGDNAFSHKLDIHVQRVLAHGPLFEPLAPEMVGNRRVIPLGRHTGPFIVGLKLKEHGLSATPEQVAKMVDQIEQLALKKRDALTDGEFLGIAQEVIAG